MKHFHFCISDDLENERLDKVIFILTDDNISRTYIQKLMKNQQVLVNGKVEKASFKVKYDDVIDFDIPDETVPDIVAENIPLDVLYEDDDIVVVNKPKNMVVHPAAGHFSGTLVNALLYHCKDSLSGINGVMRPGIVHRIDKDTTGSLIICKNDFSHQSIAAQLKEHSIVRRYRAICCGVLKEDEGTIHKAIGRDEKDRKKMSTHCKNGKDAITHYKVLQRFKNYSYIECRLETGRTHQIRVHMSSIGHPLLGDSLYSNRKWQFQTQGQCLHAYILGFIHPKTGEYVETVAPIPVYFQKVLNILQKE